MKITHAEGYKKPGYAVAVAAAMVAMTVSGCGAGPDLEGATVLNTTPDTPNEREIELAGDVPEYLVDDTGDQDASVYYEPDLVLEGGAPIEEP